MSNGKSQRGWILSIVPVAKIRTLTGFVKSQFPAIFFKNSSDVNRLEADASALYKEFFVDFYNFFHTGTYQM